MEIHLAGHQIDALPRMEVSLSHWNFKIKRIWHDEFGDVENIQVEFYTQFSILHLNFAH